VPFLRTNTGRFLPHCRELKNYSWEQRFRTVDPERHAALGGALNTTKGWTTGEMLSS
jgi:hypothetical protein